MEKSLILETTFLIDFERQREQGEGATVEFLREYTGHRLFITHTVAGEMAAGASLARRETWREFLQPFGVLPWTEEVDRHYGRITRYLRGMGALISANDLWIGATGLAYAVPVVTANEDHFRRVPDLEVLAYRTSP